MITAGIRGVYVLRMRFTPALHGSQTKTIAVLFTVSGLGRGLFMSIQVIVLLRRCVDVFTRGITIHVRTEMCIS